MKTRLLLTLAAALACSVPVAAQPVGAPQVITVVDSGTACVTAPTACATFQLDAATGGFTFSLSGTATGTITFEGTNNGDTWTSVMATNVATGAQATTTTAIGLFTVPNVGFVRVRARATAAVTGTWIVTGAKGLGFARAGPTTYPGSYFLDGVCLDATNRDVGIARSAANTLKVTNCSSTTYATIGATGVQFPTDSTYDIGTSVGGRPKDYWGGGTVTAVGNIHTLANFALDAGQSFLWGGRSQLTSPSDGGVSVFNAASTASVTVDTGAAANGQVFGLVKTLTELTTIAAAATTDTTIQMPAGAVVLAVSVRVTVIIPTAATFTVGDSGSAARFSTAAVTVAAGSTDAGTKAGAYYNASALSIRITPNLTPGANSGRVRVTIYYYAVTPPSS